MIDAFRRRPFLVITVNPQSPHQPLVSVVLITIALNLDRTVESAMVDGMITALALLGLISLTAGACRQFATGGDGDASARRPRQQDDCD